ncbi:unnamed protein product [Clonostachys solani]|uniref:Uncharacterized protein n=1 Tax=Clonostachys solani TaxID=160281 RepID=A0A9N9Z7V2_9HYPO|nr:unnamed protein product [Clonostachys solani]
MAFARKKPTLKPCDIDPGRRHRARSDSDDDAPIAEPSPSKIQQISEGSVKLAQTSARCVRSGTRSVAAAGLANLKWILLILLLYYLVSVPDPLSMISNVSLETRRPRLWRKTHYDIQWSPIFYILLLLHSPPPDVHQSPYAAVRNYPACTMKATGDFGFPPRHHDLHTRHRSREGQYQSMSSHRPARFGLLNDISAHPTCPTRTEGPVGSLLRLPCSDLQAKVA